MSLSNRDETPVRVTFTLPRHLLDDLDEYAEAAQLSRSQLIQRIVRADLTHVDLDAVRWFANAPSSKYESVWGAAKRLNAEAKGKQNE